jgi:penicillin G amidase
MGLANRAGHPIIRAMRNRQGWFLLLPMMKLLFCPSSTAQTAAEWEARARALVAQIRGNTKVPGLQKPVRVVRDRWGVAHIYAQNQHDLFFAQGFVAAQDRLFQMELWKRSGQGRLAEVMGESEMRHDVQARLLRYRGDMDAEYKSYSPDTKEILEAFTDGINAYIRDRQRPGGQGLPVEFLAAGFAPEFWKPTDCLNRMAAYSMTGNGVAELAHAQAVTLIGPDKAALLFAFDPPAPLDPPAGVNYLGLSPELLKDLVGSDRRMEFAAQFKEGSNNWTVSGNLTASGKPLLANDPHRILAEPSLRYIVHLVAPGWNVIGAGEPALPGVAAGHNEKIAWGFTIFGLDQQDLYLEEVNPADRKQYRTEKGWENFAVEMETLSVRGHDKHTQVELEFTRHGPVLWRDATRALALRWVGAEPGTAGYLGSLSLDRAANWQEFEEAMKRWKLPSENIVYADVAGNIGEHSTGLAPLRKNWDGLLPVPGNGSYEWAGFVPTEELPHTFNPAAGFVATANHKMIPEGYPYKVGNEWAPPERFQRITELLEEARVKHRALTLEDMEALQGNDVLSIPARARQALLRRMPSDQVSLYQRMILDWDCRFTRESAAAALYEAWDGELEAAVTPKRIPASLLKLRSVPAEHIVSDFLASAPAAERNEVLLSTLNAAGEKMRKLQGNDPAKWAWGKLHVLRLRHGLDQILPAALVNPPVVERSGNGSTVNATYGPNLGEQLAGASYREIMDLSDWDRSVAVNTPGQSGQPGSKHYADLLLLWNEGRYFPLSFSKAAVNKESVDVLELVP